MIPPTMVKNLLDGEGTEIMSDEPLMRANDWEIFEAIISQLQDPEVVRLRRIYVLLSVGLFVLGSVAVAVVCGPGWGAMCGFCATFVPGLVLGWVFYVRHLYGLPARIP